MSKYVINEDCDLARYLASAYATGANRTPSADVYANLCDVIIKEFIRIFVRGGLSLEITETDPYADIDSLFADVSVGRLKLYAHLESSYFDREVNLMMRAVHDAHHYETQCDFTLWGEIQTCAHFQRLAQGQGQQVLFSEIVLNAGYYIARPTSTIARKLVFI